jgi:hypothetical protein
MTFPSDVGVEVTVVGRSGRITFHSASETPESFRVIDPCESEDAHNAFQNGRIMPNAQTLGDVRPARFEILTVHRLIKQPYLDR